MITDIGSLKLGLVLSMLTLILGITMGVLFGANAVVGASPSSRALT